MLAKPSPQALQRLARLNQLRDAKSAELEAVRDRMARASRVNPLKTPKRGPDPTDGEQFVSFGLTWWSNMVVDHSFPLLLSVELSLLLSLLIAYCFFLFHLNRSRAPR